MYENGAYLDQPEWYIKAMLMLQEEKLKAEAEQLKQQ